MFSKKTTKFDKIFTVDLILFSKCQINGEDFVNFCGLLRKHEVYLGASGRVGWCFKYLYTKHFCKDRYSCFMKKF